MNITYPLDFFVEKLLLLSCFAIFGDISSEGHICVSISEIGIPLV